MTVAFSGLRLCSDGFAIKRNCGQIETAPSIKDCCDRGVEIEWSMASKCRIPDDCIDEKRYPLFMARAVLQEFIESLQPTTGSAKP